MTNKTLTIDEASNGLDVDKLPLSETITEKCAFDKTLYKRMTKYVKAKGSVRRTQDLTRLAVSYFLDKEGY